MLLEYMPLSFPPQLAQWTYWSFSVIQGGWPIESPTRLWVGCWGCESVYSNWQTDKDKMQHTSLKNTNTGSCFVLSYSSCLLQTEGHVINYPADDWLTPILTNRVDWVLMQSMWWQHKHLSRLWGLWWSFWGSGSLKKPSSNPPAAPHRGLDVGGSWNEDGKLRVTFMHNRRAFFSGFVLVSREGRSPLCLQAQSAQEGPGGEATRQKQVWQPRE